MAYHIIAKIKKFNEQLTFTAHHILPNILYV